VCDGGVFEALAEAIDELEVPAHGPALAEGYALADRLAAKLSAALGDFDAGEGWDAEGATSLTAWLRQFAGMSSRQAHGCAKVAKRLHRLPCTRAAWIEGSLSGGQVQAVVANVAERHVELFAEHEGAMVPALSELDVADTATAMREWAARADALDEGDEPASPERALHLSRTLDGRRELSGSFDPEGGDVVATALRLSETDDVEGEPARSPSRRRADALVDVCRWFLDHQHHRPGGRHRPHVNVIVDLEALESRGQGRLADGSLLDATTTQRLACDAGLHRVVTAGRSTILDYGTTTRTVPPPLFAALVVRDGRCRFGACDRPPQWCEAHHVVPVAEAGPTCMDNLVLACSRHHHVWHRPGWHVKLRPDGEVETTTPEGRVYVSRPPPGG
jgi:hypothetical protein